MNTNLFKSKMKLHNDTQKELADFLDIVISTLSFKISGKQPFNANEIKKIKIRYGLTAEEIDDIFFNLECSYKN